VYSFHADGYGAFVTSGYVVMHFLLKICLLLRVEDKGQFWYTAQGTQWKQKCYFSVNDDVLVFLTGLIVS